MKSTTGLGLAAICVLALAAAAPGAAFAGTNGGYEGQHRDYRHDHGSRIFEHRHRHHHHGGHEGGREGGHGSHRHDDFSGKRQH